MTNKLPVKYYTTQELLELPDVHDGMVFCMKGFGGRTDATIKRVNGYWGSVTHGNDRIEEGHIQTHVPWYRVDKAEVDEDYLEI